MKKITQEKNYIGCSNSKKKVPGNFRHNKKTHNIVDTLPEKGVCKNPFIQI